MKVNSKIFTKIILGIFIISMLIACDKTPADNPPASETGIVSDVEGNVYKTVKIGEQWWMAENLRVSHFRNGNSIAFVDDIQDTLKWDYYPAWCFYNNNPSAPGYLYNWKVVSDTGRIAPQGWHVPTDEDWKKMEKFLGMEASKINGENWRGSHEGEKLKKQGPDYWVMNDPIWNTNETGFSATAGGCRMFNKNWSYPIGLTYMGFWWTSSIAGDSLAWYRHLDYKKGGIFRYYGPRNYGLSIRCVKD